MATPARSSDSRFRFGSFEADQAAGELRKAGSRLKLQGQPWQVLLALLENAGRVVTRDELRERLWPADTFVDFDHGLNIAINKIRGVLNDTAANPCFIETVPKRGYRFIAPVERIPSPPLVEAAEPLRRAGRFGRGLAIAGGILLLAALAAAVVWRTRSTPQPRRYVVAVLPLRNMSAESESDYFTDGLTDGIISSLSLIDGLEVRSRNSSFRFKDAAVAVDAVARELHANLILEGSASRAAGRLHLTVDLVRAADDVTVWSGTYERDVADPFTVQNEVSRSIANALRLKGVGGQRRYNTSPRTLDQYLLAMSLANETAPGFASSAGLGRAIELLGQVTADDPAFAPAYAATAVAWGNLRNRGRSAASTEQMRRAAEKAFELDPLLPDALVSLGLVHASDLRWQDAESDFRRALALDPNSVRTHDEYARFVLLPEGRTEEAVAHLSKALELDPLSPSRRLQLATALIRGGRCAESYALAAPIFSADPANENAGQLTARTLMLQSRLAEAVAILEKLSQASHGYLGYAYATAGRRAEAEALAREPDPAAPRHRLLIYTALGDRDRSFAALQAMVQDNDYAADWFPGDPELAPLRDDARMREFRRERRLTPILEDNACR
jgi:TolB-like protein/DNA-binding winged helix-turn-helix (wHTH) protein/Tfp pilus assembly protein PilF